MESNLHTDSDQLIHQIQIEKLGLNLKHFRTISLFPNCWKLVNEKAMIFRSIKLLKNKPITTKNTILLTSSWKTESRSQGSSKVCKDVVQGWRQEISDRGADASNGGANYIRTRALKPDRCY